jgi:hypothetical protein
LTALVYFGAAISASPALASLNAYGRMLLSHPFRLVLRLR